MNEPMRDRRLHSPKISFGVRRGDLLLACGAGLVLLGLIFYAIVYLSRQSAGTGMADGIIVRKTFVPAPETQITFGQGGLDRREVPGEFTFDVRVPLEGNHEYKVPVDPATYAARREGDHILFRTSDGNSR